MGDDVLLVTGAAGIIKAKYFGMPVLFPHDRKGLDDPVESIAVDQAPRWNSRSNPGRQSRARARRKLARR